MKEEQSIQEQQYQLPYHYIPNSTNGRFSQTAYWSWGFRYLGGLKVAKELCKSKSFKSLLDIGCGDGRFLTDLYNENSELSLKGIDYSARAIALAKAITPELDFQQIDITESNDHLDTFDVVTLIEVVEHIPKDELEDFIGCCYNKLNKTGRLIVTVPHTNKYLNEKHFQHFNSSSLAELLGKFPGKISFIPFDSKSKALVLCSKLIGGSGENFIINNNKILSAFYRFYLKNFLYVKDESQCLRIACVLDKSGD